MVIPKTFNEWAALAVKPQRTELDWPCQPFTTAVVTVATGYPPGVLTPLIRSLRVHSQSPLVVATDRGEEVLAAFPGDDLVICPVRKSSGYRPYPALARIEYYMQIIASLPASVEQVLFVDSRDVLFQADPFAGLDAAPLVFFDENDDTASWTLATINGRWAWAMLPAALQRSLTGKPIVNGGVIAGSPTALAAMCYAKLDVAMATHEWTKHTTGLDNIATNVVAHAGLVRGARVVRNHTHVANIYRDMQMSFDGDGCITSPGGLRCPIVHMYDRRADLLRHVNAQYGVGTDGLVLNEDRSLAKPEALASTRHWLKLARIRLLGR